MRGLRRGLETQTGVAEELVPTGWAEALVEVGAVGAENDA